MLPDHTTILITNNFTAYIKRYWPQKKKRFIENNLLVTTGEKEAERGNTDVRD